MPSDTVWSITQRVVGRTQRVTQTACRRPPSLTGQACPRGPEPHALRLLLSEPRTPERPHLLGRLGPPDHMQRLSLTFKVSEVHGPLLQALQSWIASGHSSGVTGANIPTHTEPREGALSQRDADGRAGAAADPSPGARCRDPQRRGGERCALPSPSHHGLSHVPRHRLGGPPTQTSRSQTSDGREGTFTHVPADFGRHGPHRAPGGANPSPEETWTGYGGRKPP